MIDTVRGLNEIKVNIYEVAGKIDKICVEVIDFLVVFLWWLQVWLTKEFKRDENTIRSSMLTKWQVNFEIVDLVGRICQDEMKDEVRWRWDEAFIVQGWETCAAR